MGPKAVALSLISPLSTEVLLHSLPAILANNAPTLVALNPVGATR